MENNADTKSAWLVNLLGVLRGQLENTEYAELVDQLAGLAQVNDVGIYYEFCARIYGLLDSVREGSDGAGLTTDAMTRDIYKRAIQTELTLSEMYSVMRQLHLPDYPCHYHDMDAPSPDVGIRLAHELVATTWSHNCPPMPNMADGDTLQDIIIQNRLKQASDRRAWLEVLSALDHILDHLRARMRHA